MSPHLVFSLLEDYEIRGQDVPFQDECMTTGKVEHQLCDSYYTPLPSKYFKCQDMNCLYTVFDRISSEGEYPDNDFLCYLVFPRCQNDVVKPLCRQYCKDGFSSWGKTIFFEQVCHLLPDTKCFKKPIVTYVSEEPTCSKHNYLYCADAGIGYVDAEGMKGRKDPVAAMEQLKDGINNCSDTAAKFFFCGVYWPHCEEEYEDWTYPCLDYCDDLKKSCPSLMTHVDCEQHYNKLKDNACVDPISRPNFSLKRTTKAIKKAAVPPNVDRRVFCPFPVYPKVCGSCQTFSHDLCSELGFKKTFFPNYGAENETEARRKFDLMRPAILSSCHPQVLVFFCGLFFPVCEDARVTMSCKDLCQEISSSCVLHKKVECSTFMSKDQATCLSTAPLRACKSTEFKCDNINTCIPKSSTCDSNNDCGDWSDETHCFCDPEVKFQCDKGMCIPKSLRCDGVYDCPYNSDEREPCECKPNQIQCANSSVCYMEQWVCDGEKDCPGEEDEENCDPCAARGAWSCVNKDCIPESQRCDGQAQCSDHSDEIDCRENSVSNSVVGNTLLVTAAGYDKLKVCYKGFSNTEAETACRRLGQHNATSFKQRIDTFNTLKKFLLSTEGSTVTALGRGHIVDTCPDHGLVVLDCYPAICGRSKISVPPANIESSIHGTWPWLAYILLDEKFLCGATIIGEFYLLTSAQCVRHLDELKRVQVATGSKYISPVSSQDNVQPNKQFHKVEKIIVHPEFKVTEVSTDHDIALILVNERITYNEETKPVCRPAPNDVFTRANDCFLAGWGQSLCKLKKDQLRQRKLTLWDESKCNSTYYLNGALRQHEGCAHFYNGFVAIGKRDSGSPIFCNDEFGTFKLVGIAPVVKDDCVETTIITFAAVQNYIHWINKLTEPVFVCDNQRLLAHESWLCNNVDDCGDNSDELKPCQNKISPFCSFDDKFLCGYQAFGSYDDYSFTSGSYIRENLYPLFDHTHGNYPGHWISLPQGTYIKSPMVTLNEAHCVRFHYHMRGVINTGAAIYHYDGKKMETKFDLMKKKGLDVWLMGTFDVDPGPFQMFINSYQDVFSVDDIFVFPGSCESLKCFKGEFQCYVGNQRSCLPDAARCNVVKDCRDAVDENDCNYMARSFECTFENGNLCGFIQSDEDDEVNDWVMLNSSVADLYPDETNFDHVSGSLMRLSTNAWTLHKKVTMMQVLVLKEFRHCLKFFYKSSSPAHFTVYLKVDNEITVLRKIALKRNPILWRSVFVNLPQGLRQVVLYYEVKTQVGFNWDTEVLIDYVTISRFMCACPGHTVKCVNEDKCLPKSKVCDGKKDCENNSDEQNCPCKDGDIKCKNGQCVSSQKACDGVRDCQDGVDEGVRCDYKRSVSCSFEDDFLCGYKLTSSSKDKVWRVGYSNGTEAPISYGHYGDSSHTNKYELALEGYKKSQLSLTSIPFDARNKSMKFSFILYNPKPTKKNRGRLVVSGITYKAKDYIWSTHATKDRTWKTECVSLPDNSTMRVIFESFHPRVGTMRLELDEIILLTGGCV